MTLPWASEKDFEVRQLPDFLHNRLLDWQRRNFPDEYGYLMRRWPDFYRAQSPFRLVAKLGPLRSEMIEVGRFQGRPRFHRASELDAEMIVQTAKIIKAQCSTELGSIQQHRESILKAQDPKMQFDMMRIMAEEFRHAYQMLFVLADDDWGVGKDLAAETVESLLGMRTGDHVLDAFNLFFDSFVDNVAFTAIIDRVGKYQLDMQLTFSYAPMARSMSPMLYEEAFHIASGVNPLRQWAVEGARGEGNVSTELIQQHLNKWVPRGLEMFGDERGGKTVVDFGFKDKTNREAAEVYHQELKVELVDTLNYEVLRLFDAAVDRLAAPVIADRVLGTGEAWKGCRPDQLFLRPAASFFRRRGGHAFEMNDVRGKPFAKDEDYLSYLRRNLPDGYITGPDFKVYGDNLKAKREGKDVQEGGLPFYG